MKTPKFKIVIFKQCAPLGQLVSHYDMRDAFLKSGDSDICNLRLLRFHSLSISLVHLSSLEAIKPMSRCIAYLMIKHLSEGKKARRLCCLHHHHYFIGLFFFLNGRRGEMATFRPFRGVVSFGSDMK